MSRTVRSDTKKSYPLTSVRFFAAFLVLFHHSVVLLPGFDNRGNHPTPHDFLGVLSFSFSVSVSFFSLLSGYVLSFVYLHTGQVIDKGKFFAARFARLYPLYIVILILDTPELFFTEIHRHGVSIGLTKTAEIFAANVLMLQAWYPLRLNQITSASPPIPFRPPSGAPPIGIGREFASNLKQPTNTEKESVAALIDEQHP